MDLNVLLWILGGGFTGTWGLCIFFMSQTNAGMLQMRNEMTAMRSEIRTDISEIRKEITELHKCVKDHHSRICLVEHELEME